MQGAVPAANAGMGRTQPAQAAVSAENNKWPDGRTTATVARIEAPGPFGRMGINSLYIGNAASTTSTDDDADRAAWSRCQGGFDNVLTRTASPATEGSKDSGFIDAAPTAAANCRHQDPVDAGRNGECVAARSGVFLLAE